MALNFILCFLKMSGFIVQCSLLYLWADLEWGSRHLFFPSSEVWLCPQKNKSSPISYAPVSSGGFYLRGTSTAKRVIHSISKASFLSKQFFIALLCRLQGSCWSIPCLSLFFCKRSDSSMYLSGSLGRFNEFIRTGRGYKCAWSDLHNTGHYFVLL